MQPPKSEPDFEAWLNHAKALAVVSAWNEAGLFAALLEGPRPLSELPAEARALAVTAPVLRHLGLLIGEADRVALSPTARRLLEDKAIPTGANLGYLRDLSRMLEVLEEGGPVKDDEGQSKGTKGGVTPDPERTRDFLDRLYRHSEEIALTCWEWLRPWLPAEGASMLDLGGGHGRYARVFADRGVEATLFDFPHVIDYCRQRHGEALRYRAGDFNKAKTEELGGPYDLIFLSNIVHGEPDRENERLMGVLAGALKPGGWLVLKDMFLDERACDPERAVLFGLTMLYYTEAGQSPSVEQAARWMKRAGLGEPQITSLEGQQLVRAQRPA